jgi:hypothetical protein
MLFDAIDIVGMDQVLPELIVSGKLFRVIANMVEETPRTPMRFPFESRKED